MEYPTDRPPVKMVGEDGNAFAIMGRCKKAARKAGWSAETIEGMLEDMQSSDYNHILGIAMEHFDVDAEEDGDEDW